jgi:hypothetical protein
MFAVELADRLASLVVVRWFPGMGVVPSRTLRSDSYARMKAFARRSVCVPFRRFLRDVRREFMQSRSAVYGTLCSYLRDALHEGIANAVACLPTPRT